MGKGGRHSQFEANFGPSFRLLLPLSISSPKITILYPTHLSRLRCRPRFLSQVAMQLFPLELFAFPTCRLHVFHLRCMYPAHPVFLLMSLIANLCFAFPRHICTPNLTTVTKPVAFLNVFSLLCTYHHLSTSFVNFKCKRGTKQVRKDATHTVSPYSS